MFARSSILLSVLLLTGCPDETVTVPPDEDSSSPGVQLLDGDYELRVLDVTSIACEGVEASQFVGQSFYGALETRGTEATFSVDGYELAGSHRGGELSVEGELTYDYAEEPNHRGGDSGEGGGSEAPDSNMEAPHGWMSLDAKIHSTRAGIGDLSFEMDGCSATVVVSLAFGLDEEAPVYEEGGEEVPCDGEETDCG